MTVSTEAPWRQSRPPNTWAGSRHCCVCRSCSAVAAESAGARRPPRVFYLLSFCNQRPSTSRLGSPTLTDFQHRDPAGQSESIRIELGPKTASRDTVAAAAAGMTREGYKELERATTSAGRVAWRPRRRWQSRLRASTTTADTAAAAGPEVLSGKPPALHTDRRPEILGWARLALRRWPEIHTTH